jgi:prevent-host-death family protein
MSTVNAFEAKTKFGELLDRVARGEEIVITRYDKPVARLVPEGRKSLSDVRKAVAGLRALRMRLSRRNVGGPKVSRKTVKEWIEEGRQ